MSGLRTGFVILAGLAGSAPAAYAETYMFRVNCADESYIALWDSGSVDPGRGHFRIATGDANLNCSIYDFNAKLDANLPQRWCSDPGAAIEMFPPILLMSSATHCR